MPGMTGFETLVYNEESRAWERDKRGNHYFFPSHWTNPWLITLNRLETAKMKMPIPANTESVSAKKNVHNENQIKSHPTINGLFQGETIG